MQKKRGRGLLKKDAGCGEVFKAYETSRKGVEEGLTPSFHLIKG